jgi:cyanate permease
MLFCVAIFGLGGPMISIGCPKTISEWFGAKERGTAVGIYMAASAVGGLAAFSLINSVIMPLTGYNWRLTFLLASLPAFMTAILWWFLARDIKSTGAKQSSSIVSVFTSLIRISNVRLILIMGLLSFTISHGFTNWLPKILETGGLTPTMASFAASIPLLIGIPSVLLIPRVTKPHQRGYTLAILYCIAILSLLVTATTSGGVLITGLCLWGISSTCAMPLLMLVLMDIPEVGAKYMGTAGGLFFCIAEIGGFLGPAIIGAVKNMAGTFLSGSILMAALALILAIMSLMLKIRSTTGTVA